MLLGLLRMCLLRPALWLVALLVLCLLQPAAAQSRPGLVSFQRVAVPDEVPAHISTALVQDAHGLIWIGTQDGLVRYDGYSFKVYQPKPGDDSTLGGSYVRALCVAHDGRLWVGTISDGLSVYDPRTERFTRYRHDAARPDSLAHDRVEAIVEDRDGSLWLATDDGLDHLDPVSGRFMHFRHDEKDAASLANNQVRALLFDRAGRLWVGTRNGLQRWQGVTGGKGGFERIASDAGDPESLAGQHITRLFEDASGQLWIGTVADGLAMLDIVGRLHRLRPAGKSNPDGLSHYWVYGITQASAGEIWVATFGGGVDVVDPATFKIIDHLRHDSALPDSIGGDRVGSLLVDRSGLVWAGSWGGGLAWHDPSTRAFLKWRHSPDNREGPTHEAVVRTLETADGSLWLGTNGNGIDVMDEEGHLRGGFRPNPAQPGALADGSISCMAQAADGAIWVATLDGTLHRMRPGRHDFERLGSAQGLPGGPIRTMTFGPDGALWAGSLNGLARIGSDGSVKSYAYRADDDGTLSGHEVESLIFTKDGTLWVGTENGLNAFNTKTGRAARIRHDPARADSLPDNWVPDLMVARDGRLWLATQSGVAILDQWDGRSAHFDVLTSRLHLPAHPADSLIEDAQGQVWLGSRIRIDPVTWRYRSFGPAEGNDFRTLYIASRVLTRNGALLFGSPEGLLVVRPDSLRERVYQPPLVINAVSIEGREQIGATSQDVVQRGLALQPGQRNLRVEFAALDFSAPQKLQYRYRLEGYDTDWVTVGADQRVAVYTGLPPGKYSLRIQAGNRSGAWSPAELHMPLDVAPDYYQTWWFRAALMLLAALAIYCAFRLRLRQLSRRSQRLELAVAERTAALKSAYQRIEQASLTDPLTQLHNRRFLEQTIQADFDLSARRHSASVREPDSDLVLLMLDLDHFKQVNDQYGHAAGDAVLMQTARLLKQCMRASDHVVRWGGEEFLLVARFIDRAQAPVLAEKIRNAVAEHAFELPDGRVLRKTVSIGFAAYPFVPGRPTAMTLDTLQRMADTALYAAKHSWRNAWVGVWAAAHADMAATAEEAIGRFLADAEAAVAEGQINVVQAPSGEGALRWNEFPKA